MVFFITNDPITTSPPQPAPWPQIQWALLNVYSYNNASNGYAIEAAPFFTASNYKPTLFSPFVTLNPWNYVYSYGNAGYGLTVSGVIDSNNIVYSVYGFNISNCFFNVDVAGEMYINTLGGGVKISDSFIGLGGTAANMGHGIYLDKNTDVMIDGCIIQQNMGSGIYVDNTGLVFLNNIMVVPAPPAPPTAISGVTSPIVGELSITNCRLVNNNFNKNSGGSGGYSGINIINNTLTTIVGCRIGGQFVNTQAYGVEVYDASTTSITGCNLYPTNPPSGSSLPLHLQSNASLLRASSNLGYVTSSCGLSTPITPTSPFPFNQVSLVNHNLSGIPQGISVVPDRVDFAGTGITYWVQDAASSKFYIYLSQPLSTTSGPESVQFYWKASLNVLG